MYNQDLIFRPWKTSFKYVQNQGWGKPSVRAGGPDFFVGETVSGAVVWHDWREGKLLQIPQTPERQNLREMFCFKMDPPRPHPQHVC